MSRSFFPVFALGLAVLVGTPATSSAAMVSWDGGSLVGANWTRPENWVGDVAPAPGDTLAFPSGAARLSNVNDFPSGTAFGGIAFDGATGGYTLAGNAIVLGGNVTASHASGVNTIALPITLNAPRTFAVTQAELIVSGAIAGSDSLTKVGPGRLSLHESSPSYTGSMNVNAGTLFVNGDYSRSDVFLSPNAWLQGKGVVHDIVATATSTLAPGDPGEPSWSAMPRRLSSTGDVTLSSGATLRIQIEGPTPGVDCGQLSVDGAVDLNGAALVATRPNFFPASLGLTLTIVTASGGLVGTFAGLPDLAFFTIAGLGFQIVYGPTSVVLVRVDEPGPLQADLSVTLTDGVDTFTANEVLQYTIVAGNAGPSNVGAFVDGSFFLLPVIGVTCSPSAGSSCGEGLLGSPVDIRAGGAVTYHVTGMAPSVPHLNASVNIHFLSSVPDPVPGNNMATDEDFLSGTYFTVTACRLIDTRLPTGPSSGPALAAGTSRTFPVSGSCGIPASARAVAVNVTAVNPTAPGNLRLYPTGAPIPDASALVYSAGQTRGSSGIYPLGSSGQLDIHCTQTAGTADLVVDVFGYFVE